MSVARLGLGIQLLNSVQTQVTREAGFYPKDQCVQMYLTRRYGLMYTSNMQKSASRWWDWPAVILLFILLQIVATRLVVTIWTPFLFIVQAVSCLGFVVGTTLGYTVFSERTSRWLSFLYMMVILPLQWTLVIKQVDSLEEKLISVGGRLLFSFSDLFARRPVDDPFFFVAVMTVCFWILGASAGFKLVRRHNYLAAVIPSAIGLMVIQAYNNFVAGRIWFLAVFAFFALLLLGRLNHLENKKSWRERRIFLSTDDNIDLTRTTIIIVGLIILVSWIPPASLSSLDSAVQMWNQVTSPWRELTHKMENAVSALKSPPETKRSEFFGSELLLGQGFPLSDQILFTVQAPDIPFNEKPPRYYWRGRTYNDFSNGQWQITGASFVDYSPEDIIPIPISTEANTPPNFIFQTGDTIFSLLYAPAQPVWISRPGNRQLATFNNGQEIISWFASPSLRAGEAYQVHAVLNNPNQEQLRTAGTAYPEEIKQKYLELPNNFSTRISELANEITSQAKTPYDKAVAITYYLRNNIKYASSIPKPPLNTDPLEWVIFDYKQGYCVYYASSEVLMLRSLGVPARMAVGYAQGERKDNTYIVRRLNAHAWPEVYFPDIGWIEFEPTGNQDTLTRPLPPHDDGNNQGDDPNALDPLGLKNEPTNSQSTQEADTSIQKQTNTGQPFNPTLIMIPIFIAFATLTVYFSRRYAIPARIPVFLRASIERSGAQAPGWIINWERWVSVSSIERSFESINFGLRLLKYPLPIHATPAERARALSTLIPAIENQIKALLDEHQTSLYTSRIANITLARNVAFHIRIQVLIEKVRNLVKGKPTRTT